MKFKQSFEKNSIDWPIVNVVLRPELKFMSKAKSEHSWAASLTFLRTFLIARFTIFMENILNCNKAIIITLVTIPIKWK